MRKLVLLFAAAALAFASCCTAPAGGVISTETPQRPAGQTDMVGFAAEPIELVRVGVIGLGMRGPGAVNRLSHIEGCQVVALCDIREDCVKKSQQILQKNGKPAAAEYFGDENVWKQLCERDDIDLVYICTDWKMHAVMGVYAMEQGKHVAIEVPAAMTLDEIWSLINTSERTRKHCMQLENCVYDFFELTSLNMAQKGLFGEVIHVEGAYIHNLVDFWEDYYNDWRLQYNRKFRGDVYPTHGIGPVCQVLNIHRGDRMKRLVCMDTKSVNGKAYYEKNRGSLGETPFQNGDHTVTLIQTEQGKTIEIHHNVMTPRPYNRMYQLTGTKGFANKYPINQYVVDPAVLGETPMDTEVSFEDLNAHRAVSREQLEALMQQYKHPIHKEIEEVAKKVGGHGGMDYVMDYRLIYCLRNGLPLDMDVYDLAEWCCLAELTRKSLENNNSPVEVPDFTRGAWNRLDGLKFAGIE